MRNQHPLFLHEEVLLLALHREKGTIANSYIRFAMAGALVAEMLLEGRISIDDSRRNMVDVRDPSPTGDPVLDRSLQRIAASTKRVSLRSWIGRLGRTKGLRHDVARRLCERGILREDQNNVLLVFTRTIYPQLDPAPKQRIVERMREAIRSDSGEVDPRTVVLISLARGAKLLTRALGRDALKGRRDRIKQIVKGEATGKATKEVIEASQAAVFVAAVMPGIASSSHR